MKRLFLPLLLLALSACAPNPELDYCASMGTPQGHPEFVNCTQYYFQQQAAFSAERAVCAREADQTYPPTLYSRPHSYPARFYGGYGGGYGGGAGMGFSRGPLGFGYGGHTQMVHVGADYQHNAEVDALRSRIIEPCMQKRGWVSGSSWTAGRIPPRKAVKQTKLPWLK